MYLTSGPTSANNQVGGFVQISGGAATSPTQGMGGSVYIEGGNGAGLERLLLLNLPWLCAHKQRESRLG